MLRPIANSSTAAVVRLASSFLIVPGLSSARNDDIVCYLSLVSGLNHVKYPRDIQAVSWQESVCAAPLNVITSDVRQDFIPCMSLTAISTCSLWQKLQVENLQLQNTSFRIRNDVDEEVPLWRRSSFRVQFSSPQLLSSTWELPLRAVIGGDQQRRHLCFFQLFTVTVSIYYNSLYVCQYILRHTAGDSQNATEWRLALDVSISCVSSSNPVTLLATSLVWQTLLLSFQFAIRPTDAI